MPQDQKLIIVVSFGYNSMILPRIQGESQNLHHKPQTAGIFTVRAGTLLWKWMLPIAGCLVISVPVSEFYIVSWNYLWLILMVPVGLAMIILGVSATPQMQVSWSRAW